MSRVHALRTSELAALDCGLLELLPALYRHSQVKVTLTAACEPHARKKSSLSECTAPFKATVEVQFYIKMLLLFRFSF